MFVRLKRRRSGRTERRYAAAQHGGARINTRAQRRSPALISTRCSQGSHSRGTRGQSVLRNSGALPKASQRVTALNLARSNRQEERGGYGEEERTKKTPEEHPGKSENECRTSAERVQKGHGEIVTGVEDKRRLMLA